MTSSAAQPDNVPDLENLYLNEIESNGAGTVRLRFDGQASVHVYNEINIFLTDASIVCAEMECAGFFPLTRKISIDKINRNMWSIKIYFEAGRLVLEAAQFSSHLSTRRRGALC